MKILLISNFFIKSLPLCGLGREPPSSKIYTHLFSCKLHRLHCVKGLSSCVNFVPMCLGLFLSIFLVCLLLCPFYFISIQGLYVSNCVEQVGLDSQRSSCLWLPSAGIIGVCHHDSFFFPKIGSPKVV